MLIYAFHQRLQEESGTFLSDLETILAVDRHPVQGIELGLHSVSPLEREHLSVKSLGKDLLPPSGHYARQTH